MIIENKKGKILLEIDTLVGANLSGVDLNEAVLFRADLSGADLSGADLYGTNLNFADLRGASLIKANLSDANLTYTNLISTDLSFANLTNANLNGVDLSNTNLHHTNLIDAALDNAKLKHPISFIKGSRHTLQIYNGELRIGCVVYPINYWLKHYEEIGEDEEYTPEEIEEYYSYIKLFPGYHIKNG